jgi:rhodanese-related sulfurtransferase
MSPAELRRRLASGAPPVILDVRSASEFRAGHVPGAINLPYWKLLLGAAPPFATDAEVVVYCGHGPRAKMAGAALRSRGVRQVSMLDGHWAAWVRD